MDLNFYEDITIIVRGNSEKASFIKCYQKWPLWYSVFDIDAMCLHSITGIGVWSTPSYLQLSIHFDSA